MKKIIKFLIVFLMVFSALSSQKSVYASNEQLNLELLPLVQDTEASPIANYSTEYSEDEAKKIIGQRLKNAYLNGESEVSIADLNLSTDKRQFIRYLRFYFPFISNGAELGSLSYRNNIFTKINITNTMTIAETKNYFNAIDQEVSSIISLVSPDMDDMTKALIVHDYFVNYCEYQLQSLDEDSYRSGGILYKRTGVCQAYAYAYQYIMNQLGIECHIASSVNMNHAWNIIKIDNHYYHVDVTWDDPVADKFGQVQHNYFLLSDEAITNKKHYDWDRTDLKCNDTKYDDYYWKDITSPIVHDGDYVFFARDDGFYKRNSKTQEETLIKKNDQWKTLDDKNSYYIGNFSGLFMKNHKLYYNTSTQIRCMDENGKNDEEICTPDTSKSLIYGIRYEDNYVYFVLQEDPITIKQTFYRFVLPVDITQINLPSNLELSVGTIKKLDYSILPTDYNESITWSSDHPEIVQVDQEGNIQCKALGDAIITVTSETGLSAQCQIHVVEKQQILGDVNDDGKVNYLDAIMILRYDANIIKLDDNQLKTAEVNGDGRVNYLDAIMILRYEAGIINNFES